MYFRFRGIICTIIPRLSATNIFHIWRTLILVSNIHCWGNNISKFVFSNVQMVWYSLKRIDYVMLRIKNIRMPFVMFQNTCILISIAKWEKKEHLQNCGWIIPGFQLAVDSRYFVGDFNCFQPVLVKKREGRINNNAIFL